LAIAADVGITKLGGVVGDAGVDCCGSSVVATCGGAHHKGCQN
jgi:hypothetical protein